MRPGVFPRKKINNAAESIMLYINKYGNHFENEKGEYYSIKHSYGPVTVNAGGENEATIENSRMYLTSRYKTSSESEFPLELGVYYEYNESGWFGKDDFILNVEHLLTVLHQSLEEDFSEMEDTVSFELLGLANWKD